MTTLSCFDEADSAFVPRDGMYSVASHVHHVAETVDWFIEAAFGKGWDLDFERGIQRAHAATSLEKEKAYLDDAFERVVKAIGDASEAELEAEIPDKTIMPGTPRSGIVGGITDHTAHHRGALAVYARLLGKQPPMPYSEA